MEKKVKTYGLIVGVILFILLVAGFTYAFLEWSSSKVNISANSDCFTINYEKGQDISGTNLNLLDETNFINGTNITIVDGMVLSTVAISINSTCNTTGRGTIKLNTTALGDAFTTGNSVGSLKYVVINYSSTTYPTVTVDALKGTTFTIMSSDAVTAVGTQNLIENIPLSNSTKNEYIIIFYIDEVIAQNDVVASAFTGNISAEAVQG